MVACGRYGLVVFSGPLRPADAALGTAGLPRPGRRDPLTARAPVSPARAAARRRMVLMRNSFGSCLICLVRVSAGRGHARHPTFCGRP
jgi:hypothetical protein